MCIKYDYKYHISVIVYCSVKLISGAEEMAQLLRVLAAFPKDPSLVPSTNVR